jgi:hypothetical protein
VTHQNCGHVKQRLSDLGCPLDCIEGFLGYAGMGRKQMNSSQKDSYLQTPPVQPIDVEQQVETPTTLAFTSLARTLNSIPANKNHCICGCTMVNWRKSRLGFVCI